MTTRSIIRTRTPRKNRMWGITNQNGTIIAATHAALLVIELQSLLQVDVDVNFFDLTASAIRLNISYRQTTAKLGDDDTVAMGIAWVSESALAVGGVAIPDPSTDHFDWMFHDIRTVTSELAADGDSVARNGAWTIRNDSMRKQRENHSNLVAVFRATLLQSVSVQVFVGGRVLFLMP